jgi:hypothetical protein
MIPRPVNLGSDLALFVKITSRPKKYLFRSIYDLARRGYSPRREFPLPNMKTPSYFEKLSTSAGLLVLGAGFVSLGALSFIKSHQDAESGLLLNTAYPIIGGLISVLLGSAFFAIALVFTATLFKEKKASLKQRSLPSTQFQLKSSRPRPYTPGKVDRARDSRLNPLGGSCIDRAARSRRGDYFGPEVVFCQLQGMLMDSGEVCQDNVGAKSYW